ncbi:LacI family DNA-binding transcriptional regulator [Streptomyces sp. NPDC091266]|uniref:LacI family DNA-binding transcriptional regulator n=1 Tax=Streptomyces sp. NPDC091266 TaxID=3365978 RepID=UPI0037F3060B
MEKPRSRTRPSRAGSGATLQQVATQAGVSLATASRVLHGSGSRTVGEELRRRVEAAASELRYVPNAPAQTLARAASSFVGLIVHDVADPYFGAIAAGAMRAARERDLLVMIAATSREPGLELEYLRGLRAQRARAVILAGSGTSDRKATAQLAEEIAGFESEGGRVVCIGERGPDLDAILLGNREGADQAIRSLWELGHRRIGVVSGPPDLLAVRHRLDGARRALRELGSPLADGAVETADFTREGGRQAAVRLLTANPDLTAVLALNDVMAAGVLKGLQDDLGIGVPDRISVIGFDDVPFAADLRPSLSTVSLPLEQAGEQAMSLLTGPPADAPLRVTLRPEVVQRASSGPAIAD